MTNRRTIIKSALAAVACAIAPPAVEASAGINSWVLVAEEVSANGWKYPAEELETMAKSAKGILITAIPARIEEEGDSGELRRALGVVTHATFHNGAVWVIPKWFGGQKPKEFSRIAPWGYGRLVDGHIEGYKLDRMCASRDSAFANAGRI